jgi:transcriptional regulator with XRE-family HTH domain
MDALEAIRHQAILKRKQLRLRQAELARLSGLSLDTVKSFEQGRLQELGFTKLVRLLAVLGLELRLHEANLGRPTLDELLDEESTGEAGDQP